jgi:hypothetical protein
MRKAPTATVNHKAMREAAPAIAEAPEQTVEGTRIHAAIAALKKRIVKAIDNPRVVKVFLEDLDKKETEFYTLPRTNFNAREMLEIPAAIRMVRSIAANGGREKVLFSPDVERSLVVSSSSKGD